MRTKRWMRLLSMILCLILSVQCCTFIASAEESAEVGENVTTQEVSDNPIVCEVTELRDANTKYFLHQDRSTLTVARYPDIVHYQKDGEWLDINNKMIDADASATGELKPSSDHAYIRLNKKTKGHILTIGEKDDQIKLDLLNAANVNAVIQETTAKSDDPQELENVTSSVIYADAFDDVDLRFDISGSAVKDNFVLKNSSAVSEFQYKIITGKNTLKSNEDGSITIYTAEGEQLYHLVTPFMYDDNGKISYDVTQSVEQQGNNYILTISADRVWLEESDRAYPVTIDPLIEYVPNNMGTGSGGDIIAFHHKTGGALSVNSDLGYLSQTTNVYLRFDLPVLDLDMIGEDQTSVINESFEGGLIQAARLWLPTYSTYSDPEDAQVYFGIHDLNRSLNALNGLEYWDPSNQIYYDKVMNYLSYDSSSGVLYADITALVQPWYDNPANNKGLAIVADSYDSSAVKDYTIYFSKAGVPYLSVQYTSVVGLEDYFSYTGAAIEGGGTAYVNNATGELCYSFNDYTSPNTLSGVDISHVYNDASAVNGIYNYDRVYVGTGFRLNIQESLCYRMDCDDYLYSDSDGTMHFFTKTASNSTVYEDESGMNRTVSGGQDNDNATLTYENGTRKIFNSHGHLIQIIDTNGNKSTIEYTTGAEEGTYLPVTVKEYYNDNSNSRTTTLTWDQNYLQSITTPENIKISYTYNGNDLQKVTFANSMQYLSANSSGSGDKQTLTFSYASPWLSKVTSNVQGGEINISRIANDGRVSTLKSSQQSEGASNVYQPNDYDFAYYKQLTTVTDADNYCLTYVFDQFGRAIITNDNYGNSVSTTRNTDNKPTFQSDIQTIVENLYKGGGVDSSTDLSGASTSNASINTSSQYMGAGCLALSAGGSISRQITVSKTGNYSLSAYIKTTGTVTLSIGDETETFVGTGSYEPFCISAALSGNASETFKISSTAAAYIDNIQVLNGYSDVPFNILKNASFSEALSSTNWLLYSGLSAYPTLSDQTLKLDGQYNINKRLYQTVEISGNAGDTFVFGGRMKTDLIPYDKTHNTMAALTIRIYYEDGSNYKTCIPLQNSGGEWQVIMDSLTATKAYTKVAFFINCSFTAGTVYYDDLFVYKNNWGTSYAYDSNGHLSSTTNSKSLSTGTVFNDNGDLESTTDAMGYKTSYLYYDDTRNFHKSINEGTGFIAESNEYDSAGNVTASFSGNSDGTMYTRNAYNTYTNKLLLKSTSDATGAKTSFTYDSATLKTATITAPNSSVTTNTYYKDATASGSTANTGPLKSVSVKDSSGNSLSTTTYQYDNGSLSKINRGKATYSFEKTYGIESYPVANSDFSLATVQNVIKVNDNTLSTNVYDNNGNLLQTTYGNGTLGAARFSYDNLNRLVYKDTGIGNGTPYTKAYYRYQHDNLLSLVREPLIGYTTRFLYDDIGNVTQTKYYKSNGTGNVHTYTYNDNSWVTQKKTKVTAKVNGTNASETFRNVIDYNSSGLPYRQYNRDASISVLPKINYNYDSLNRPTNNQLIAVGSFALTNPLYSAWDYADGYTDSAGTTFNVSNYRVRIGTQTTPDFVYNYTYDSMGNITKIANAGYKNSSGSNTFTYDALSQLKSASIYQGASVSNYTESFTYVNEGSSTAANYQGNIATVKKGSTTYTYAYDSACPDVLSSISGSDGTSRSFTHDALGNTLTDGKHTFAWNGRLLTDSTTGSKTAVYEYNADGKRVLKTVGSTTYEYFYDGDGRLEYEIRTVDSAKTLLYYTYSRDGLELLTYIKNFGTTSAVTEKYWVMKNTQGDVMGLVKINADGSTAIACLYYYSSFGELLRVTDASGNVITATSHIAHVNPIRYRGYYYDTETGLYYVSSRYYDPEIGRWINADGVMSDVGGDIRGYNLFAYCMNNPVNMSDHTGNWPSWATKLVAAVAVVAVVAAVAAITVATAGAGTAAAVIAVGAAKGAAIGLVTGAAIGAGTAAVNHRVSTGSWEGADKAALEGAGDGALSGAITGAVTGAASGATKVAQAAKAWDSGTFKSGYQSMKYHYNKHVVSEGLTKGNNVLKYTQDAVSFANRNSSVLKYTYNYNYGNASWNLTYSTGQGGMFTSAGKILTFWYR